MYDILSFKIITKIIVRERGGFFERKSPEKFLSPVRQENLDMIHTDQGYLDMIHTDQGYLDMIQTDQ